MNNCAVQERRASVAAGGESAGDAEAAEELIANKMPKVQRKWEVGQLFCKTVGSCSIALQVFPGKNSFYCDGRVVLGRQVGQSRH